MITSRMMTSQSDPSIKLVQHNISGIYHRILPFGGSQSAFTIV